MSLLLLFQAASSSYVRRVPSGVSGPAMGDVILCKHGDRGRVPLEMGGIRVSWAINDAGEFSAFCRLTDALEFVAEPSELRGWWLMWEHPTLGAWGGVIGDLALRSGGILEIAAQGWLALLDKRLTRRRDTTIIAHAGAIAARLVRDAGAIHPTGIAGASADEWGEFVTWRDDGGEVLSAISRLAAMSDQDYCVGESDRIFYWRRRFGSSKAHRVQLVQGTHVSDWRPAWSLSPVVTEVILSPSDRNRFAKEPSVAGHDAAAYAAFGPRQQRGTIRGRVARSSVQATAERQAAKLARRGQVIDFDVVNADGCFGWVRKGDTITVLLPEIDKALVVRCLLLSWDMDSDVLRVSGEIQ